MPEYDVVVAGAGNAGLCAALAAAENGARALVLEKAPEHLRGGTPTSPAPPSASRTTAWTTSAR